MRIFVAGFTGWIGMGSNRTESLRIVDTAVTVIATLLVAATYVLMHR